MGEDDIVTKSVKNAFLCSFQGSPSEDRNFRSDVDDMETEEASFSGQEDSSDHIDILEWAKVRICFVLDVALYIF